MLAVFAHAFLGLAFHTSFLKGSPKLDAFV